MRISRTVLLFIAWICVGTSNGHLFLEDGQEYIYETQVQVSTGTMDYAAHSAGFAARMKTRIQVEGNSLNLKFEQTELTQYVGPRSPKDRPYEDTSWTVAEVPNPKPFTLRLNSDGLFEELTMPAGVPHLVKNIMRGWASILQINSGKLKQGQLGFQSEENLIFGKCRVTYTVTENTILKVVSIGDDCEKRSYRLLDEYRGFYSNHNQQPEYPHTTASTAYIGKKKANGKYQIDRIVSTNAIVVQLFEEEGAAQLVFTNTTSRLVTVKSSPGDISASGESISDISYDWADKEYQWNKDRDLKAREPFFASGEYLSVENDELYEAIIKGLSYQEAIVQNLDTSKESIDEAHRFGINNILPLFYAADYDTLRSIADTLHADKSDSGKFKSKAFGELLSTAGTTASALLVRDFILEGKFDNDRDSARILTGVPFHIRRPNTQLVKEFEKLLDADLDPITKQSVPLTVGHLVRMTCERADSQPFGPKHWECIETFINPYLEKLMAKFHALGPYDIGNQINSLFTLFNIRYGKQSELLKDVIYGKTGHMESVRTLAITSAGFDALVSGKGAQFFMPIFADRSLGNSPRSTAFSYVMYANPTAADLATVVSILYDEKDYELVNTVYSHWEMIAENVDPYWAKVQDLVKYYLKYMKQYSNYQTDFGFGVSKTYVKQFYNPKYGYAKSAMVQVTGSSKSMEPSNIYVGFINTFMSCYQSHSLGISLSMQGIGKTLVRKLTSLDPNTWKLDDLETILQSEMGIKQRPDQYVYLGLLVFVKGTIVFTGGLTGQDFQESGAVADLLRRTHVPGRQQILNYLRAFQLGSILYESPTAMGLPMAFVSSQTVLLGAKLTAESGTSRGMIYRDLNYHVNALFHANRITMVPMRHATYGIVSDRISASHLPGKLIIGVNPVKKELKLSVKRPEYDEPLKIIRHFRTTVMVRSNTISGDFDRLRLHCPNCQNKVVVSKGPEYAKSRTFVDQESRILGSYLYGEYFDCELDIRRGKIFTEAVKAFMPYNKNPKTFWNSVIQGYNESKTNPVREIEVLVKAKVDSNGERFYFSGRKWFIKALIKAKGEPADRSYRLNIGYEFTPGHISNKLKVQFNRASVADLGMSAYSACLALENKYPDFPKEFLSYDENTDLKVTGKALVQYGKSSTCSDAEGEINLNFEHSTTQEARDELKDKWYYKQCMDLKNSPAWAGRDQLPYSESCYMTLWDATSARRYTWSIKFVKLTNRLKAILNKAQTIVKAGLLPYWDIDPETMGTETDIGPFLNIDATLKDNEKSADIKLETRQGEEEFNDVPLRLDWSKRLRNLRLTSILKRLFRMKIINPCIVTSDYVRTNDNVTFTYQPSTCYTLASATCGPKPVYAVFTKKVSGPLPLAMTAFIGGHKVEMNPSRRNIQVSVNGNSISVSEGESYTHSNDGVEIFKIFRWGSTYTVYSFLKVSVIYDGNFAELVPALFTRGQHCGICGNYNLNPYDEFTAKDMSLLPTSSAMAADWKWKC